VIQIEINERGGVAMLHDDAVNLAELGKIEVSRASHVEFSNVSGQWYVQSAKTLQVLHHAPTRAEALAWEKEYYSPDGEGWAELTGGKS
jgi:hypothetical protein